MLLRNGALKSAQRRAMRTAEATAPESKQRPPALSHAMSKRRSQEADDSCTDDVIIGRETTSGHSATEYTFWFV